MQSDRVAGIVCFMLGAGYLAFGLQLTGSVAGLASGMAGPSAYPRALAVLFMLMSLGLIVWPSRYVSALTSWFATIIVLTIGASYVVLLPLFGFLVTSIVAAPLLMAFAGERRPSWLIGGSLSLVFLVYFLFRHVLVVLLPPGSLLG
ncbi:MAG: tripartite tricarboxylate transporter TctB family protein [Rhizobiaceae bacterium]